MPGLIVVWVFHRAFGPNIRSALSSESIVNNERTTREIWQIIIIAYIVGQLLQTVLSEQRHWLRVPMYLRPVEELFASDKSSDFAEKKLVQALKEAFGDAPPSDWFYLSRSYLQIKKLDSYVDIMHERYGFFRGLFLALLLSGCTLLIGQLFARSGHDVSKAKLKIDILLAALCFSGAAFSLQRMIDYDNYYARATYETFYVDYSLFRRTSVDQSKQ